MSASTIVAAGLVATGGSVLLIEGVRTAVLWIVEPGAEAVVPIAALLLAAGVAVGVLTSRIRPGRRSLVLLLTGPALIALTRVVAVLTFSGDHGGAFVAYGPGTPPSFSWTLRVAQVTGPAMAVIGVALVAVATARLGRFLLRSVARQGAAD